MPLTVAERRYLMPFRAQLEVAQAEGVSKSYVSAVMRDAIDPKTPPARKRLRRVQVALARKLSRPIDDVFPKQEAASVAA